MSRSWPPRLTLLLATGFGAGYTPWAPGTAGSLVGLGFGLALAAAPLGPPTAAAVTAAVCIAGVPICGRAARDLGESDPARVVWDEVAGMMVAVLALPAGAGWYWWAAAAFVLFRAFDVLKPWPVGWIDRRVGGGLGIMLDDLAAGALAWAAVQGLAFLLGNGAGG